MTHAERDVMHSLQRDADSRLGVDAQLGHSLEEQVVERRCGFLSELSSHRLVDRCRPREEMLIDTSSTRGAFSRGFTVTAR